MGIPSYMFDTVVFNRILDGVADIGTLCGKARFYATHIQLDELSKTSNLQRRRGLLAVFQSVTEDKVPTESAVWDVSAWDQAKWGEEDGLYSALKSELDRLNNKKKNNIQDALIAETSIKNQFTLLTDDNDLRTVINKRGGKCVDVNQMVAELGN